MSEAEQVAMVTDMLADYENIEANFNRLFRAYLKGDIAVIMAEANDIAGVTDPAAAERLKQRLIDERNRVMRSEEHTSELQSLMRISYAVFCLKNKKTNTR